MEFSFTSTVVLNLKHYKETGKTNAVSTDINLEISKNLDEKMYLDNEGLPTKDGSNVLSNTLIQGFIANIHASHQNGYRDSAEHLRWIISELERGFIQIVDVSKSQM